MERIKQKLEAAFKQRVQFLHGHTMATEGAAYRGQRTFKPERQRLFALKHNNRWLFLGMAVVTASLMLGSMPMMAAVVTISPPPLVTPDVTVPDAPASAPNDADTPKGEQSGTRPPPGPAPDKTVVIERQKPVIKQQPAVSVIKNAPWVINLISSLSKDDANRMAEKAHSMDIQTKQQQVTVKGKQYWRVQVTGFSTEKEARAYSGTVMEKLGLKDVWIMKR